MATREGVEEEARWIPDTAAGILDEFARPRRVCLRFKRRWTDEISELRKELGEARRADRSNRTKATKAARPLKSHQTREEGLLEHLPGKCQRRGRVDGLYISFVTDFYRGDGEAGLLPLSPTFGAGRQT